MQLYSKKVMEHFRNPRNMGVIKKPDGKGRVGNPVCGDIMEIYIKVGRRRGEEYIKEIRFQTLGCAAAIATSSMVTEMVKGKSLREAMKITNKAIAEALGGLPKHKLHCSVLAAQAIRKAIEDYKRKQASSP